MLVAGTNDYSGSPDRPTAEVYSQQSNSWSVVGQMGVGRRYGATATALADGRVLISGGVDSTTTTRRPRSFRPDDEHVLLHRRPELRPIRPRAARLSDGRVLVGRWLRR